MSLQIDDLYTFKQHRNHISESLDTEIIGREKEINEICDKLDKNDYISITGPAGIGKSRLAIAVIEKYSVLNDDVIILCTQRFCDYIASLDSVLNDDKKYVIFIDDANNYSKLTELLDYIEYRNRENIKVVLTIRDYLKKCLYSRMNISYYEIKSLNDSQIKEAICKNTVIKNDAWLNQVTKIANGNVRVAFLAANEALKNEKGFSSLFNQKDILNSFYKDEISKIDDSDIIVTVGGILAFFKSIYLEQLFYIAPVLKSAGISKQDFLKSVNVLISKEIVDDYMGVVKISDQCFSDYLLNYTIIDKKLLKLKDLLLTGFKYYKENVIETLGTILHVYYSENLLLFLKKSVIEICDSLDDNLILKHDIEAAFSPIIPEYVTVDFKHEIDKYNDKKDIKWMLDVFLNLTFTDYFLIVNEGVFKLLKKSKKHQNEINEKITNVYRLTEECVKSRFVYHQNFIDCLMKYEIYNESMFSLVSSFMNYSFRYGQWQSKREYRHYSLMINDHMEGIIPFRRKCWEYLFKYYPDKTEQLVVDFTKNYIWDDCFNLIKNDFDSINETLQKSDQNRILRTVLYFCFSDKKHEHDFNNLLAYDSEYLELLRIILDKKDLTENYEEYQKEYERNVSDYYINNKTGIFSVLESLNSFLERNYKDGKSKFIRTLLIYIDEYSSELFTICIETDIAPYTVIERYAQLTNLDVLYELINKVENESIKDEYLYNFYRYISFHNMDKNYDFIVWLNSKWDINTKHTHSRSVLDLRNIYENLGFNYVSLVKKFFNKRKYNAFIAHTYLSYLFYEKGTFKELIDLDVALSIEIYEFFVDEKEVDYQLKRLGEILEAKKNYIKKYAKIFITKKIKYDEEITLIFEEKYCQMFFDECMALCMEQSSVYPPYSVQKVISENMNQPELRKWVESYIDSNYRNDKAMLILFSCLSQTSYEYRNIFLVKYYQKGINNEILKCAIHSKIHSYSDAKQYYNSEILGLEMLKKDLMRWDNVEELALIDLMIDDYNRNIEKDEIDKLLDYNFDLLEELRNLDYKTEVSLKEAYDLYINDSKFREMISSGYASYNDGNYITIKNEPVKFTDALKNKKIIGIKLKSADKHDEIKYEEYLSSMKYIIKSFNSADVATLDDCLISLFTERKWETKDFMDNTFLSRDLFSKILKNEHNKMKKKTLIQILIGLQIPKMQRNHLLEMNETQLSMCVEEDALYSFILDSKLDIETADELLKELGKPGF